MSGDLRTDFYEENDKNLRSEYLVDVETKMLKQVHVEADGIRDAEEKVMDMIIEDELMFTNADAVAISLSASEVRYPFQNLNEIESELMDS